MTDNRVYQYFVVVVWSGCFFCRISLNDVWKEYASECIDNDFLDEKKASVREYEIKKIELKDNLIQEFEDRKKSIEDDRYNVNLIMDNPEAKPANTRKLRRRPNEPTPLPEKRRKLPQSHLSFLLDEKEVEEDLVGLFKGKVSATMRQTEQSMQNILFSSWIILLKVPIGS